MMLMLICTALYSTKRRTVDRMDRMPCELLHYILWYIDQPSDLFRMSCVCSRWRSFIMNDEYFLNQWFSRSLEHSQESFPSSGPYFTKADKRQLLSNIDQSLFPVNLRSNEWCLLPWPVSKYLGYDKNSFCYYYPISLFRSSHSFSFWLFLPCQYYFNIQTENWSVNGVCIWLCGDRKYNCGKEKHISIADRWIHIVVSKIDSQSNYQICIDGQYLSKLSRHDVSVIEMERNLISSQNIISFRRFDKKPLGTPIEVRIANLIAFKRCLTLVEIQAIHQQQTAIEQVKVGTYINNNRNVSCHSNSNYFSYKFIFLFFLVFLILLICYFFSNI
jgi:hypothetical protein